MLRVLEEIETKPLQGNNDMLEVVARKDYSRYRFLKEGLRIVGVKACRTFDGEAPPGDLQSDIVNIRGFDLSVELDKGINGYAIKDIEEKLVAFRKNFNE